MENLYISSYIISVLASLGIFLYCLEKDIEKGRLVLPIDYFIYISVAFIPYIGFIMALMELIRVKREDY